MNERNAPATENVRNEMVAGTTDVLKPKLPRVEVSDDCVTFTVQHEICITAEPPPCADDAESLWLSAFAKSIKLREKWTPTDWSKPLAEQTVPDKPLIQAVYHSSSLPIPCTSKRLSALQGSNGLVSACLTAFAKVHPPLHWLRV